MAKKAKAKVAVNRPTGAAAIQTVEDSPAEKLPKGYKKCPHCQAVIAARSTTCKECGKAIAPKNPKAGKQTAKSPKAGKTAPSYSGHGSTSAVDLIKQAQAFVSAAGGTKNASDLIALLGGIVDNG